MNIQTIKEPLEFSASLGGLHDLRIDTFAVDTDEQTLKLDISTHFDGAPEYQGQRLAALVFSGVTEICLDVDLNDGIRISNVNIVADSSEFRLEIDLNIGGGPNSGGRRSITAKFQALSLHTTQ